MNAYEIVKIACKENKDAENFCNAWVDFAHALDDCVDRDKPVTPDAVAKAFTSYTLELAGNPFFQVNKGLLVGLMVQSANYWVESHRLERNEQDVTKCFWHSVVYEVAHLIGGWDWMREVMSKTLEFDHEPGGKPAPMICDRCDDLCTSRSQRCGMMVCPRCRDNVDKSLNGCAPDLATH